jgi:hypothetical protein
MFNIRGRCLSLTVTAVLFCSVAQAQTTFGVIRGRVLDTSGAGIANVPVTVTNESTNISRTANTGETGAYEVGYLQPGTYTVSATQPGFKKFVATGIAVSANATVLVDVNLEIGDVTSSVTVEGSAPVITTESAVISDVKTQQQYLDAAMNVRGNWDSFLFNFMSLVPGVQPSLNSYSISFAGSRYTMNNFTVDGITTNSTLYGNMIGPANPSMDFIQEVKVDLSGNSAEFSSPGHVSVVTKGGSNDLHGSAYWYYNTAGLNARNFFQNSVGFAVLNNYGFSVSGPVFRNKTFFSGGLEGFNQRTAAQPVLNLPSPGMRAGDFSRVRDASGRPIIIRDPLTNAPFPGNVIPNDRLNETALRLQERFFPAANYGDLELLAGNYRENIKQGQRKEQVDIRIDHNFNEKNSLFARFDAMRAPNNALEGSLPTIGFRIQRRQTRNFVVSDTHVFRSNLINEFRFGLVRGYNPYSGPVKARDVIQELGLTGLPGEVPDVEGLPIISISGMHGLSQLDYRRGAEMIFQWQDNLSWIKGRHTFKFGGEVWHNYGQDFAVSPSRALGSLNFTGAFTGHGYADLLLGIPFSASRSSAGFEMVTSRNWDTSIFFQDDFRATSRLTLNLGIRYEVNRPYTEDNNLIANFDPFRGVLVVPNDASRQRLFPAFVASNLVPIVTAKEAGLPTRTLGYTDTNNVAPRFGFAYKLTQDNRTVVRGGYGVFYDSFTGQLWRSLIGGPYAGTESTPPNTLTNGSFLWTLPAMFPSSLNQSGTASLTAIDPHIRNPIIQQFNLSIEREWLGLGFRASYTGTKTHQLVYTRNLNQLQPSTIPFSVSRRPFPQLSSVNYRENGGSAIYNGLILSVERRYKNGFQFQVSHTWAKNLTDTHSEGENGGTPQNSYDRLAEWGDYAYTRRHRFMFNAIWELPFGAGRRYASNGWLKHVAGGWSLSAFGIVQTGQYFTPTYSGADPANIGSSSGRPDRIASGKVDNPTLWQWFDTSAFLVPPANSGRFGNSGVNILRGPGTEFVNLGLFKRISLTERVSMRAEATFTNVFNHPNFAVPDSNISSSSAAVILSTHNLEGAGPRTTRLGLRLEF